MDHLNWVLQHCCCAALQSIAKPHQIMVCSRAQKICRADLMLTLTLDDWQETSGNVYLLSCTRWVLAISWVPTVAMLQLEELAVIHQIASREIIRSRHMLYTRTQKLIEMA